MDKIELSQCPAEVQNYISELMATQERVSMPCEIIKIDYYDQRKDFKEEWFFIYLKSRYNFIIVKCRGKEIETTYISPTEVKMLFEHVTEWGAMAYEHSSTN